MKLGRTEQEREAREKAKAGVKDVFAFLPMYCYNTDRWVWLEMVRRERAYFVGWNETITSYYEIGEGTKT